ncbi:MAG TPA: hypothetical protein VM052_02890 [Candidatus Limnocylindrales bacterium]|nr:hypothetical protein [Candidatus Limnocylindrales bacterium]
MSVSESFLAVASSRGPAMVPHASHGTRLVLGLMHVVTATVITTEIYRRCKVVDHDADVIHSPNRP